MSEALPRPASILRPKAKAPQKSLTCAGSGVDIDKKDALTESLDLMLRRTHTDRVIPNPGGFSGLFRLDYRARLFARNYNDPVLVACCDGVGTTAECGADFMVRRRHPPLTSRHLGAPGPPARPRRCPAAG